MQESTLDSSDGGEDDPVVLIEVPSKEELKHQEVEDEEKLRQHLLKEIAESRREHEQFLLATKPLDPSTVPLDEEIGMLHTQPRSLYCLASCSRQCPHFHSRGSWP